MASFTSGDCHKKSLSNKSRSMYQSAIGQLLQWLLEEHQETVAPLFLEAMGDWPLDEFVVEVLTPPVQVDIIPFPLSPAFFNVAIFELYLSSLRKRDEQQPDPSTLSTHRTALTHLFTSFQRPMPPEFGLSLKEFFKGAKRITAQKKASGDGLVRQGKEPFSFSLYSLLCLQLLKQKSSMASIFAHAFLTLSWNLMCRAGTWDHAPLERSPTLEQWLFVFSRSARSCLLVLLRLI